MTIIEGGQILATQQLTLSRSVIADPHPKSRKQALHEMAQVVNELRQEAQKKGIDKMSKREIRAAVSAARSDLKKNGKRPSK